MAFWFIELDRYHKDDDNQTITFQVLLASIIVVHTVEFLASTATGDTSIALRLLNAEADDPRVTHSVSLHHHTLSSPM